MTNAWTQRIWQLLQEEGLPADDDGTSQVVYVTSYYVDHERLRQNDHPRPLRFDEDYLDWENGVRLVWEDLIHPTGPIDIVVVQPQPPFLTFPGTIAAVIAHQNWSPGREPCLVSIAHISDPRTKFDATALSTDIVIQPPQLIRLMGVEDLCHQRFLDGHGPCTVHIGFEDIAEDQDIHVSICL